MFKLRLSDHYDACEEKLLTRCIECGQCVDECRIMKTIPDAPAAGEIISGIKDFLRGGELSAPASLKTTACMGCYGCVDSKCPIGLDSLRINELVMRAVQRRKKEPFSMTLYDNHMERSREFTNQDEFARITTPLHIPGAKYVLFPGCNVYRQPDKILNMFDIMDTIGNPYSFIPGIQYCCGLSPRGTEGDADWLQDSMERLISKAVEFGAETIIFWCPTCVCNLEYRVKKLIDELPFEVITFGKYVFQNVNKLSFSAAEPHLVTLHEPCKTAYMQIDLDEVRNILRSIPGTTVVEMKHHHENTMCCGCHAVESMPEVGKSVTDTRMDEALASGAQIMLDVCHNCHWIFRRRQIETGRDDVHVENYSGYLASALGYKREDSMSDGVRNTGSEETSHEN